LGGVGARVPAEHEPMRRGRLHDLGPHRALPLSGLLDDLRSLDVDPSGGAEDAVGVHRPPGADVFDEESERVLGRPADRDGPYDGSAHCPGPAGGHGSSSAYLWNAASATSQYSST